MVSGVYRNEKSGAVSDSARVISKMNVNAGFHEHQWNGPKSILLPSEGVGCGANKAATTAVATTATAAITDSNARRTLINSLIGIANRETACIGACIRVSVNRRHPCHRAEIRDIVVKQINKV